MSYYSGVAEVDVKIVKKTELALLVDAGNKELHWIPKSLMEDVDVEEGEKTTISVKRWFLEQEGII